MSEIWKDIPGYEGRYQVSDQGQVLSRITGRCLAPQRINSGYLAVHLYYDGVRNARTVHRLVASAFIPHDEAKPHINHKNGNKSDNRAENLERITVGANNQHAYDSDLREPPRFAVIGVSVRDGTTVTFESQRDAEIALSKKGKQSSAINHCLSGKKKSAYGYTWRRCALV